MEKIYQFVDDIIESRRDDFALLPMISGIIRKPASRNSGLPRGWPMRWKRKVFS